MLLLHLLLALPIPLLTTTTTTTTTIIRNPIPNNMANTENAVQHHYSLCLTDTAISPSSSPTTTAMVILNSPIENPPSPLFERLWQQSSFRICADGGANRLYQATVASAVTPNQLYLPDLITGDLDSLESNVRSYYESHKVPILRQYDQDFNDLDKSIRSIPTNYQTCLVYGAFGGRFDQEMGAVQALYAHAERIPNIWLYNDQNASILLQPGQHVLHCPNFGDATTVLGEGPTCGLIPLGQPCDKVTTQGFQWNLDNVPLAFGALVSTSNRLVASTVHVECSHPLLFTAEIQIPLSAAVRSPNGSNTG